ncbi:MAG: OsmC family protein [Clostridia bacterium]|nr:OsmC family protein [Clostridia bacterium]
MKVELQWQSGLLFDARTDRVSRPFPVAGSSDPAAGEPAGPTPKELLLVALAGCTGMDVASILEKMKEPVRSLRVTAEGEQTDEHPRVFKFFHIVYEVEGEGLSPDKVMRAVTLSQERYCGVSHMLKKAAPVTFEVRVNGTVVS